MSSLLHFTPFLLIKFDEWGIAWDEISQQNLRSRLMGLEEEVC